MAMHAHHRLPVFECRLVSLVAATKPGCATVNLVPFSPGTGTNQSPTTGLPASTILLGHCT